MTRPISGAWRGGPLDGGGYAAFWVVVIGLRLAFTDSAGHRYPAALGQWLAAHQVTVAALPTR